MDKPSRNSDVPAKFYDEPVSIVEGDIICGYELDDMRYAIMRAMEANIFNNAWVEDGMAYFDGEDKRGEDKRWVAELPPEGRELLDRYYRGWELDEGGFHFRHIGEFTEYQEDSDALEWP